MQITLTDGTNRMLARRLFGPREYLEQPSIADAEMAPHLAIGHGHQVSVVVTVVVGLHYACPDCHVVPDRQFR